MRQCLNQTLALFCFFQFVQASFSIYAYHIFRDKLVMLKGEWTIVKSYPYES